MDRNARSVAERPPCSRPRLCAQLSQRPWFPSRVRDRVVGIGLATYSLLMSKKRLDFSSPSSGLPEMLRRQKINSMGFLGTKIYSSSILLSVIWKAENTSILSEFIARGGRQGLFPDPQSERGRYPSPSAFRRRGPASGCPI